MMRQPSRSSKATSAPLRPPILQGADPPPPRHPTAVAGRILPICADMPMGRRRTRRARPARMFVAAVQLEGRPGPIASGARPAATADMRPPCPERAVRDPCPAISMDGVRFTTTHQARSLQPSSYTSGADIQLGSGQEAHLSALGLATWSHQAQCRVRPRCDEGWRAAQRRRRAGTRGRCHGRLPRPAA